MRGVLFFVEPKQPRSPYPKSSQKMSTKLGRLSDRVAVSISAADAVAGQSELDALIAYLQNLGTVRSAR